VILKAILCLMLLANAGRQIAYVDLSRSVKEPPGTAAASATFRAGGVIGHGTAVPAQVPLPVSIRLIRIIPSTDNVSWKASVEVVITNTGAKPIYLPIGTGDVSLLIPTAKDRRYLSFLVPVGDEASDIVGTARTASNREHPDSNVMLPPGDSVVFKIPFDKRIADARLVARGGADAKVIVQAVLYRKDLDGTVDFSEQLNETKSSDNALTWNSSSPR
jgi:hypothetical protein